MTDKKRRLLIQGLGLGLGAAGLSGCATPITGAAAASSTPTTKASPHVVVVGGGFGGATFAKYLKKFAPETRVTLVEYNQYYTTGPGSNWVLGGLRHVNAITFDYETLAKRYDIKVVHAWVSAIDAPGKNIRLADGSRISYDRLVVAPGIDFKYDAIEGFREEDTGRIPHAWKPGIQTAILRQQLQTMKDGGTFIIAPPKNRFRCPPGPYERASMVAHYFKKHKPKSKILILDAKTRFSKQDRFIQGWKKFYGYGTDNSLIEFVPAPEGAVGRIDAKRKIAYAGPQEAWHQADVLNVIPPQKAGRLAEVAHLTDDSGWCPVDPLTSESTLVPGVYVLGDAAAMAPMPKSGFAANSQAKVCAAAMVADFKGIDPLAPHWLNTCYSLVAPDFGISVARVYRQGEDGRPVSVPGSGGVTPPDGDFKAEASYAGSWWHNITQDTFA